MRVTIHQRNWNKWPSGPVKGGIWIDNDSWSSQSECGSLDKVKTYVGQRIDGTLVKEWLTISPVGSWAHPVVIFSVWEFRCAIGILEVGARPHWFSNYSEGNCSWKAQTEAIRAATATEKSESETISHPLRDYRDECHKGCKRLRGNASHDNLV